RRAQRIQEQLWKDLDHSYYSGIQVLRDLARAQGDIRKAIMPIVFTSLLIQDMAYQAPPPWQETVYSLTQTPQVWIDHQVHEFEGALIYHWQVVEELFPDGLIEEMFSAYHSLLHRLATSDEVWQATSIPVLPPAHLAVRTRVNATTQALSEELLHS